MTAMNLMIKTKKNESNQIMGAASGLAANKSHVCLIQCVFTHVEKKKAQVGLQ